VLFVVLRSARYLDAPEEVEFGEVHLFIGPNFAITVRHAESPDLGRVRKRVEETPSLLSLGPQAVLYAVFDQVVDEYGPVIHGLENDIDEIEDQIFQGDSAVSRRIYELAREAMAFQRATHPLVGMLESLEAGFEKYGVDIELRRDFRDVADHALKTVERADSFRAVLQNALTVQATLVTQAQNDEMRTLSRIGIEQGEQVKKVSSWAAILFVPGLVAAVYGMNFRFMPELDWPLGYPFALTLMLGSGAALYFVFKKRGWL
jgi:magnesium transporter